VRKPLDVFGVLSEVVVVEFNLATFCAQRIGNVVPTEAAVQEEDERGGV
jgi:hypothetical protein